MLERALERKKISQSALESKLGTSSGLVSKWISGKRRPSLSFALKLRKEPGISTDSWFEAPEPATTAA